MSRLIDLSHPFAENMPVYPGDIPTKLTQTKSVPADGYTYFRLETGLHGGTHLDAPLHFLENGEPISTIPLEKFMGKGCLLDVRGEAVIKYKDVYDSLVSPGDIVLLRTDHSAKYGTNRYYVDHPVVDEELAKFLVNKGIKMLGMDLPSPDSYPFLVHKLLLGAGIPLLENLTNLASLEGKIAFEIIAFPLRIPAEACPVRVVASCLS